MVAGPLKKEASPASYAGNTGARNHSSSQKTGAEIPNHISMSPKSTRWGLPHSKLPLQ